MNSDACPILLYCSSTHHKPSQAIPSQTLTQQQINHSKEKYTLCNKAFKFNMLIIACLFLVLKLNVCCRVSSMTGGGEGVFARGDIPPDTLVAIFNGVRHHLCSNLIKGLGIYGL